MRALLGGAVGALALACAPAAYVITTATPAGATTVSNEAQLRSAFDTDGQITLANDITLTDCGSGDVDRNTSDAALVLEGAGHTITQTCPDVRVLDVNTNSAVTLRDVTVTGGNTGGDGGGINMSSNNGGGGDLTDDRREHGELGRRRGRHGQRGQPDPDELDGHEEQQRRHGCARRRLTRSVVARVRHRCREHRRDHRLPGQRERRRRSGVVERG